MKILNNMQQATTYHKYVTSTCNCSCHLFLQVIYNAFGFYLKTLAKCSSEDCYKHVCMYVYLYMCTQQCLGTCCIGNT